MWSICLGAMNKTMPRAKYGMLHFNELVGCNLFNLSTEDRTTLNPSTIDVMVESPLTNKRQHDPDCPLLGISY